MTDEPQSTDTINDYIRTLHTFFKWAHDEYGIPDPMARITVPKSRPSQPNAIDMADLCTMFDACGNDLVGKRNRAIMAFLIDTGVRAAGVWGLRVDLIQLDTRKAIVTEKGNKTRTVVFTRMTAELIAEWFSVRAQLPTVVYNLQLLQPLTVSGLRRF